MKPGCGFVNWSNFRQHFPHELSGGMKQKVALVRGFSQKPSFVMLDEPFQSIGRQPKKKSSGTCWRPTPGFDAIGDA
jgi:NitT/TauT family transport system ATP-binding protein